jgi:hypothetical protein
MGLDKFTWIDKLYWTFVGFMTLYVPFACVTLMMKLAN